MTSEFSNMLHLAPALSASLLPIKLCIFGPPINTLNRPCMNQKKIPSNTEGAPRERFPDLGGVSTAIPGNHLGNRGSSVLFMGQKLGHHLEYCVADGNWKKGCLLNRLYVCEVCYRVCSLPYSACVYGEAFNFQRFIIQKQNFPIPWGSFRKWNRVLNHENLFLRFL